MKTAPVVLGILAIYSSAGIAQQAPIAIENAHVRYTISAEGQNLAFVDRASGIDYLKHDAPSICAFARCGDVEYPATSIQLANGRLTIAFGQADAKAVLRVAPCDSYIQLTVDSVSGANVESIVFLNVPLALQGRPAESFGACALSLNLFTRVDQLPALQTSLRASCYGKFGMEGAKVAIVGMPMERMLEDLRQVLTDANEMPHCTVAGPWARDVSFNPGSYLFDFGSITDSNVAEWIAMARNVGATQIDHHGGGKFFRFGDFVLTSSTDNRSMSGRFQISGLMPFESLSSLRTSMPMTQRSYSRRPIPARFPAMRPGPKGEVITKVSPEGESPLLSAGENRIQFSCDVADGPAPRVKLTVTSHGQPL